MVFNKRTVGRVQDAVNRLRANPNESLTSVAREEHTTTKSIKRVNDELNLFDLGKHKPGQKYDIEFHDNGTVTIVTVYGEVIDDLEVNRKNASIIGSYWLAVRDNKFEKARQIALNNTVRDIYGNKYQLSTNKDTILKALNDYQEVNEPFVNYRGSP